MLQYVGHNVNSEIQNCPQCGAYQTIKPTGFKAEYQAYITSYMCSGCSSCFEKRDYAYVQPNMDSLTKNFRGRAGDTQYVIDQISNEFFNFEARLANNHADLQFEISEIRERLKHSTAAKWTSLLNFSLEF
jgi:hypothetical protein